MECRLRREGTRRSLHVHSHEQHTMRSSRSLGLCKRDYPTNPHNFLLDWVMPSFHAWNDIHPPGDDSKHSKHFLTR